MAVSLFMFLVHGVATQTSGYRPGARHALMLFATGETVDLARSQATKRATERGWEHIQVKREKSLGGDATGIKDETLKPAGEAALSDGASIVVYGEELPLDS